MDYCKLGHTDIRVSRVCLGTMTWGLQNTQADADAQLAYALDKGVNFIDTAEMYAVPPSPDTYGKTESIIGNWLARHKEKRNDLVIASKIAGNGLHWVRDGADITPDAIFSAVDGSLKRLGTDYIDLYQLHWPNRTSVHFGKHHPGGIVLADVNTEQQETQMLAVLEALQSCIKAGKIRHIGLSNETPWGLNQYLKLAQQHGLPRIASMQNEFSLVHTKDWPYLIENCHHEEVAYLPWSPLAGGMLSGKYLDGQRPEGSRWTLMQRNGLFRDTKLSQKAVSAYRDIASAHGMTTAELALAWCDGIEGVTSTIIGATSIAQLEENIAAFSCPLSEQVIKEVSSVLRTYPVPF